MIAWRKFVVDDRVPSSYTQPIAKECNPYAVVRSTGNREYEVASAASNEDARRIASEIVGSSYGIRIYLRTDLWLGQVFYFGGIGEPERKWLGHEECLAAGRIDANHFAMNQR